ncbi:MAG: hypothetical protein ABIP97_00500 [Chthoniobacterales bacterium]
MSFQYEVIEENGEVFDELTDLLNQVRVRIRRLGAEPVSLSRRNSDGQWKGFLHRDADMSAPESGWGNHATVMGYFTHRLWKEESTYRGHTIHSGNHGFIRHFAFEAPDIALAKEGSLVYHIPSDRIPRDAYPYKVSLRLSFSLVSEWLEVEFMFENEERETDAHLSFGLHPGFAVSSLENFRLDMPAGNYTLLEAPGNFLNGKTQSVSHTGGDMPFSRKELPDSYLLDIRNLDNRVFALEDSNLGHRIEMDYSQVPYLTIWSDGGAFLCVEPCWGLPDSNPPVPFDQKTGIQVIPPGGILKKSFRIRPGFLIH